MPTNEGSKNLRPPYAALGVAGIVVATVFAAVAALAGKPAQQASPQLDRPGPVVATSSEPSDTSSVTTTDTPVATTVSTPVSSTTPPTSSTTTRKTMTTTTTTTTTSQAAPPPPPPPPPPKVKPVARLATPSCSSLTCSFDGSGSSDPDGTVIFYSWDFGDSGSTPPNQAKISHTYQTAGTYTVSLLVMDNDGQVSPAVTKTVTVPSGG
jgi:PKD domain-containing protein